MRPFRWFAWMKFAALRPALKRAVRRLLLQPVLSQVGCHLPVVTHDMVQSDTFCHMHAGQLAKLAVGLGQLIDSLPASR